MAICKIFSRFVSVKDDLILLLFTFHSEIFLFINTCAPKQENDFQCMLEKNVTVLYFASHGIKIELTETPKVWLSLCTNSATQLSPVVGLIIHLLLER